MQSTSAGDQPTTSASASGVQETNAPSHPHQQAQQHRIVDALPKDDPIAQEHERELRYGASHVIHLFIPVSVCMALVIASMYSIGFYTRDDGVYLLYTPFITQKGDTAGTQVLASLGNALVMLAVIVVMTCILILLYKFRFYKTIHGWLILSSLMLLSMFSAIYLQELLKNYNFAMDYVTFGFVIWNWAVMGMICIHWKGPLLLQQGYLISISALMALIFIKYLPDWTVWTVLGAISIWDLVAVLCPKGPLRILVETAQKRNEPIFPGLIYSSAALIALETECSAAGNSNLQRNHLENDQQRTTASASYANANAIQTTNNPIPRNDRIDAIEQMKSEGVKLGLGDFIFYSVLVGKASSYGDWNTTLACYTAILVGLCFTLVLLALVQRALPALPISIFAGITFFFLTREVITPFVSAIASEGYLL